MTWSPFHRPHQSYCWYEWSTHHKSLKDLSRTSALQTASAKAKPLAAAASPACAPLGICVRSHVLQGNPIFFFLHSNRGHSSGLSSANPEEMGDAGHGPDWRHLETRPLYLSEEGSKNFPRALLAGKTHPTGKTGSVVFSLRAQEMLKFSLKLQAQEAEARGLSESCRSTG